MVHKKMNENLPPLNKQKLMNKSQEKEYKIKTHLQMADQICNYWKFLIHWNNLGWFNSRSRNEGKNPFCVSSKKLWLKDNNKATTLEIEYTET